MGERHTMPAKDVLFAAGGDFYETSLSLKFFTGGTGKIKAIVKGGRGPRIFNNRANK